MRNFSVQANYLPLVDHTCRVIGPDAAVLFPANDWDESILGQTLRSWCNVPVATLPGPIQGTQLAAIDSSVETQGKTLWVLSADASPISQISRTLTPELIGTAKSPRELEVTVDRPPSAYTPMTLSIYGAKVP